MMPAQFEPPKDARQTEEQNTPPNFAAGFASFIFASHIIKITLAHHQATQ